MCRVYAKLYNQIETRKRFCLFSVEHMYKQTYVDIKHSFYFFGKTLHKLFFLTQYF